MRFQGQYRNDAGAVIGGFSPEPALISSTAFSHRHGALTVRRQAAVTHYQIDQARQYQVLVECHNIYNRLARASTWCALEENNETIHAVIALCSGASGHCFSSGECHPGFDSNPQSNF